MQKAFFETVHSIRDVHCTIVSELYALYSIYHMKNALNKNTHDKI